MIRTNSHALRRSYVTLAGWYCAAVAVIAAWSSLFEPTRVGAVDGRVGTCVPDSRCLDPTPRIFFEGATALAVTLVIALPLCACLTRKWELPVLAGTVAAFTAWWVSALLYCGGRLWLAQ